MLDPPWVRDDGGDLNDSTITGETKLVTDKSKKASSVQ